MITKEYLAGFVDGEGSISCYKRKDIRTKKGFTINTIFSITNTNKEIMQEIKQIIKGKLFFKNNGKNAKVCYSFQIQDIKTIKEFLGIIKDKLILKKQQAELMIEYCKSRQNNKGKEYSQREIEIAETITKLNKRGVE
ncbi:MAG: LAGLIDADG family homing endonuclease [Nanoarchaeota archaeon]